jgi:xylan 1,4-beta-xylosidase
VFSEAALYRIDDDHANAVKLWKDMGRPEYPDAAGVAKLLAASEMKPETVRGSATHGVMRLEIDVPAHGVVGVRIR